MFVYKGVFAVLTTAVLCIATALAQQAPGEDGAVSRDIRLNVVVSTASGECVTDLQQQNFKVYDDGLTQAITSFKVVILNPKPAEIPHVYAAGYRANNGCYEQGELFQYEITFKVPDDARPNQYHRVEIKVLRPNLIVQTRKGYYTQP